MAKRKAKRGQPKSPNTKPKKGVMGAPTKLTPEMAETFCNYLKLGHYPDVACGLCRINRGTYHNWMKASTDPEASDLERDFFNRVTEALAYAEHRDLARLDAMCKDDFRALQFRMERRWANRWGRREQLAIHTQDDRPTEVAQRRENVSAIMSSPELAAAALLLGEALMPKRQRPTDKNPDVVDGEIIPDDTPK